MEICKYRLPCGRCDKFDIPCDLTIEDIERTEKEISTKEECEHDWIFETESTNDYNENGEPYYLTTKHCTKCGNIKTLKHISSI